MDDEETKKVADDLYAKILASGADVIYDDREGVRPGAMFSDADLIGAPIRIVVSPRNLKDNVVEVKTRDKSVDVTVPVDQAMEYVRDLREKLFQAIAEA